MESDVNPFGTSFLDMVACALVAMIGVMISVIGQISMDEKQFSIEQSVVQIDRVRTAELILDFDCFIPVSIDENWKMYNMNNLRKLTQSPCDSVGHKMRLSSELEFKEGKSENLRLNFESPVNRAICVNYTIINSLGTDRGSYDIKSSATSGISLRADLRKPEWLVGGSEDLCSWSG